MALELSRLQAMRRGWATTLAVGRLDRAGAEYLKSPINEVKITKESLDHILKEHPDLNDFELISMSYGLLRGLFITDHRRKNTLIISYTLPESDVRYKIALKGIPEKQELWVSTFHRTRPRQTRALLARGRILKRHS